MIRKRLPTDHEVSYLRALAHRVAGDPFLTRRAAAAEFDLWLSGYSSNTMWTTIRGTPTASDLDAWDAIISHSKGSQVLDFTRARAAWESTR